MPDTLRVAFAGTPEFAAESLKALLSSRHEVVGVWTQPDRPSGRGRRMTQSPVKTIAQEQEIEVYQPVSLKNTEDQETLRALAPDVLVVVAYGLLLPQAVLDIPRLGAINVHASLLPRWRGAAPIQRAIEAGDAETGVTIMQMDAGLDTGDMLAKTNAQIDIDVTGGALHATLAAQGAVALVDTLDALASSTVTATPQPETGVTYAHKLTKAEAELDFSRPATELARRIQAFNPWPVAWTSLGDQKLRLWRARAIAHDGNEAPGTVLDGPRGTLRIACGDGALDILEAQLPGGKPLLVEALTHSKGALFAPGTQLTGRCS
ncbi:methionyl-tRNA formyltransferase [Larsenimonas suaedae]|uniref:Methionyl-tRNA formyltransferase n=1 Tax=Larsenimonas suaedae TaxID=1851019 RepID=A0ABU1GUQ6_9GAMM|nr:methionyl-tRNA formyltransferase [Larsenimonas suaedae]MCM2972098.1 methionyl-tRNA formyltransferase [Larsenimonas suaedae]MDR5895108.1 methionyl-tRNA formyltransferase [Larsenimonas suaedae]